MNILLLQISKLPKVLQDYIGMYNVEHRKIMNTVCKELIDSYKCYNCNDILYRNYSLCNTIMYVKYYYCSQWCHQEDEYYQRKSLRHARMI